LACPRAGQKPDPEVEAFGAVVPVVRPSPKAEGFGPNSPGPKGFPLADRLAIGETELLPA